MSSRALDVGREGGSDQMTGRKGRQPVSFSGPFNSTGTTPSTHTPGDVMSMSALPRSGSSSKPVMIFGVDITSTLTSPSNQLWNDKDLVQADMDVCQGFKFTEVNYVRASTGKVVCCHFSSDGKLLASGGHDKKPGYSLRTFTGHSAGVTSLDFHPNKEDLICSCAVDGEIRYWSIINGNCARVFKGGTTQVRFQPHLGRYLAAAAENVVSILDAETQTCQHLLKGHTGTIYYICWDPSGELPASVSEDSVRVWTLRSGSEGECLHELSCNGNVFYSCVFHPTYSSLLVIGCYQSLELWNTIENKIIATIPAHDGLISSLAATPEVGLVASASHDKVVKLWK